MCIYVLLSSFLTTIIVVVFKMVVSFVCTFANFQLFSMSLFLSHSFSGVLCTFRMQSVRAAVDDKSHFILFVLYVLALWLALDATDVHTLRYCRQTNVAIDVMCFHFQPRSALSENHTSREFSVCLRKFCLLWRSI